MPNAAQFRSVKFIVKYINQRKILITGELCNRELESSFPFSPVDKEQMLK